MLLLFIYKTKTEDRLSELTNSNESFKKILTSDVLFINGKKYRNWPAIKEDIELRIHDLHHEDDNCLIHGDLCFSNIFCDFNKILVNSKCKFDCLYIRSGDPKETRTPVTWMKTMDPNR